MSDPAGLPRWVAARNNDHAGVVHLAADGLWRASNWSGSLGAFATVDEAEAAVRAAPPKPKPKLKKAPKPLPPIALRYENLTALEAGYIVFAKGRRIGAVVGHASGQFAAWSRDRKIGEFATPGQAEAAVRAASEPPKGG